MATLDISVNDIMPTVFCDEDGYDIVPIQMLRVVSDNENEPNNTSYEEIAIRFAKQVQEISIP
ncbi:hypothetical protein HA385_24390 [Escherichia coli]|nr:hypothetical protein [Escherichia coli]